MSRYLAPVPVAALKVDADATQVDMSAASLRPGRELVWLAALRDRLLANVSASSAAITAYVGSFLHDIDQARPELLRVTKKSAESSVCGCWKYFEGLRKGYMANVYASSVAVSASVWSFCTTASFSCLTQVRVSWQRTRGSAYLMLS